MKILNTQTDRPVTPNTTQALSSVTQNIYNVPCRKPRLLVGDEGKKRSRFPEGEDHRKKSFSLHWKSQPLVGKLHISIVIFITSLIYYLSYASFGYSESDWGGIVIAAERFLNGDVFYKDFSIVYTPGIYLYTALFFKILGVKLWAALVAWSFIRTVNCSVFYLLGKKFFPHKIALLLPFILWIIPGSIHKSFLVFFCLLHLLLFLKLLYSNNKVLYLSSGIVAGISFAFRFDLLLSFAITLLLVESLKLIPLRGLNLRSQISTSARNLLIFCGGAILSILPLVLYLAYNSALTEAINQTLSFLGRERSGMFSLPPVSEIFSWSIWDISNYTVVFIPLGISLLILVEIIMNIKSKRFDYMDKQLLVLLVYGFLSLHQVFRWPWTGRLFQILPPFIIANIYLIIKWYFDRNKEHIKRPHLIYTLFIATTNLALLSLIIGSLTMSDMYTNNSILIRLTNKTLLSTPKVSVYTTKKEAEEAHRLIDIIETETFKNEYIYIVQYYPMYYFITNRRNATRYYFLEAYVYSEEKQLEVIKELKDKNVRFIISGPNHPETPEAIILNEYMSKEFKVIERVGKKIIYKKIEGIN